MAKDLEARLEKGKVKKSCTHKEVIDTVEASARSDYDIKYARNRVVVACRAKKCGRTMNLPQGYFPTGELGIYHPQNPERTTIRPLTVPDAKVYRQSA